MDAVASGLAQHWATLWLDVGYPAIMATSAAMTRCLGLVMISPIFNRLGVTGLLRTLVSFVFALPVVPVLFPLFMKQPATHYYWFVGVLMVEMIVGMILGVIYGLPVWAAEAAGELIDLQRGSTLSQLLDPPSATESSVTATLLSVTIVTIFFLSGGLLFMLRGVYESYLIWPAGEALPDVDGMGTAILGMLDQVLELAVRMVAPLMIAILVADLLLAYMSRMAPSLHVFDLSMPVKNLLFAVLVVLYMVVLLPDMFRTVADMQGLSDWLRETGF